MAIRTVFALLAAIATTLTAAVAEKKEKSSVSLKNCKVESCVIHPGDAIVPCQNSFLQKITPNVMSGYGTLGGLFKGTRSKRYFAITNFHVAAEGTDARVEDVLGTRMCTSDRSGIITSAGFEFGRVVAAHKEFDAVFVEVYRDVDPICTFPPGFIDDSQREPAGSNKAATLPSSRARPRGETVFKFGATTGWSMSRAAYYPGSRNEKVNVQINNWNEGSSYEAAIRRPRDRDSVSEMKRTTDFSKAGDSGALILNNKFEPVAILIGAGGTRKRDLYDAGDKSSSDGVFNKALVFAKDLVDKAVRLINDDEPYEFIMGHDLHGILYSREIHGALGEILNVCNDTPHSTSSQDEWVVIDRQPTRQTESHSSPHGMLRHGHDRKRHSETSGHAPFSKRLLP